MTRDDATHADARATRRDDDRRARTGAYSRRGRAVEDSVCVVVFIHSFASRIGAGIFDF